jgi:type II secretory ATPase GspE/PulE/Tfp pilus assembly ATPase PilB-like protein
VPDDNELTLDQIRMPADDLAKLRRWLRRPAGVVINSGPTGSGKTTVLYACLHDIAGPEVTPAIKSAILRRAPTAEITAIAVKEGMLTMAAQGMRRAANGVTTSEEVLRVLGK